MDTESQTAVRLLEALADCEGEFVKLREKIRARPESKTVVQSLRISRDRAGATLDAYVEVELKNGKAICWWLEVRWGEGKWETFGAVRVNDEQGQFDILEFPSKVTSVFGAFLSDLVATVAQLTGASEVVGEILGP